MRRSATLLRDAAVSLLVAGLLLAVIEGASRILIPPPSEDALRVVQGDDAVSQTLGWLDLNLAPLDKDVDFLWRNRPDVQKRQPVNPQRFGRHDEWTIVSNARGFRSVEPPPPEKPADELRILCIGDSVTFGFNVDQADSFPERLQAALRARHPDRSIRVINAGTPGWSWLQGLRFLEREGVALRPDVVVMAHGANDRYFPATITDAERLGMLERPGVRWMESARILLERSSTYRLVQRFAARSDDSKDLSPGCRSQVRETGKCRRLGLDEIEASVVAANRLAGDARADLVVLNVDFEETDAVTAVQKAVRRSPIPYIDIVSEYVERRAADERARQTRLGLAAARTRPATAWQQREATRVLFRVLTPPGGSSVRVDGVSVLTETEFGTELRDDGTAGDEIGGDGVWSGRITIAADELLYRYSRDGTSELLPLPPLPSTQVNRKRTVRGETILPVEVFGDLYLKAERMHPNAEGQQMIADGILEILPTLQSFASWSNGDRMRSAERRRTGEP
jgi:lysophospholipase L1-like esterase